MFQKTGAKFKVEEYVEITLEGKEPIKAVVFLSVGDRLIDLLNDSRNFIPAKRMDGSVMILAKSSIVSIIEKNPFEGEQPEDVSPSFSLAEADEDGGDDIGNDDADSAASEQSRENDDPDVKMGADGRRKRRNRRRRGGFDAYAVLKISPDATLEEVRTAYKSRIKAVHPDTLASLNLDEDMMDAAIQTAKKVNYAYHVILKERRERNPDAAPEEAA